MSPRIYSPFGPKFCSLDHIEWCHDALRILPIRENVSFGPLKVLIPLIHVTLGWIADRFLTRIRISRVQW